MPPAALWEGVPLVIRPPVRRAVGKLITEFIGVGHGQVDLEVDAVQVEADGADVVAHHAVQVVNQLDDHFLSQHTSINLSR